MKKLEDFTGLYKLSKTLRFELKPVGKTLENIRKSNLLKSDLERAEAYPKIKKILDEAHKKLLERSLSLFTERLQQLSVKKSEEQFFLFGHTDLNWNLLAQSIEEYSSSAKEPADKKKLSKSYEDFRKLIVKVFEKDEDYALLVSPTPDKYIKKLIDQAKQEDRKPDKSLLAFARFATYFTGYQENRKNIYSAQEQKTAAAYRAVNDNFVKFMEMVRLQNYLAEKYPLLAAQIEEKQQDLLQGKKLRDIFRIDGYSRCLSQKQIDWINQVIGGYSQEDGEKIQGVNECINLWRQQYPEAAADRRLSMMPLFYKQILSDRETFSYIPKMYENDRQLLESVEEFNQRLDGTEKGEKEGSVLEGVRVLFGKVISDSGIFVNEAELAGISAAVCGSYSVIKSEIEQYAKQQFKKTKESDKFIAKKYFSMEELSRLNLVHVSSSNTGEGYAVSISDYWSEETMKDIWESIRIYREKVDFLIASKENKDGMQLRENTEAKNFLRCYLEGLLDLLHRMKVMKVEADEGLELNHSFYAEFESLLERLGEVVKLQNSVRNYLTQKISNKNKIKLNFNIPTLANGWDQNKENDNGGVIFRRDGKYYLGIISKQHKVDFEKLQQDRGDWEKMVYKLFPGVSKFIPKCTVSTNEVKAHFAASNGDYVLKSNNFRNPLVISRKVFDMTQVPEGEVKPYNRKYLVTTGDEQGYRNALTLWIEFCQNFLRSYQSTAIYDLSQLHKPEEYGDVEEFYAHADGLCYNISWQLIDDSTMNSLVEEGKLFLFQIYNKDWAEGASGRKNMHTLYWETLFSKENLHDVILKLNGEAEIFWRDQFVKRPYVHKTGEKMVNRYLADGKSIPAECFKEIFDYVNHPEGHELSGTAAEIYKTGLVQVKDVSHDIIKDRRYAEQKFLFHVPISFNFKKGKFTKFNDAVLEYLKENPEVNIIGIDRGERNLLYLTLINQQGRILRQESLNVIEMKSREEEITRKVDFHSNLDNREKNRQTARRSWDNVEQIKDLKSGYLSQVIHTITRMMVEHNAIVVLEDLNFGFKRGRFHIEKQVYQNFEKALIDKLNYLVFKDCQSENAGSPRHGYQLTDQFESFAKLKRQSGFLFYVPAAYTSKIDPTTGFVNLFDLKDCSNAEKKRDFFLKFKSIRFDAKYQAFAFVFDYKDFPVRIKSWKSNWTVYSAGRRIVYDRNLRAEKTVCPTQTLLNAIEEKIGEKPGNAYDLLDLIGKIPAKGNESFYGKVFCCFERTLQMRNSSRAACLDYIESPVLNNRGMFFSTENADRNHDGWPVDADANGAFHIALKGLYLLKKLHEDKKLPSGITNDAWLKFIQSGYQKY